MNIIGAVLARPTMYTVSGSFGEIVAFLDGYTSGVARHHPQVEVVAEWSAFRDWLSDQTHTPQSEVFIGLWKQHDDNGEALACLRQLYREFKAA